MFQIVAYLCCNKQTLQLIVSRGDSQCSSDPCLFLFTTNIVCILCSIRGFWRRLGRQLNLYTCLHDNIFSNCIFVEVTKLATTFQFFSLRQTQQHDSRVWLYFVVQFSYANQFLDVYFIIGLSMPGVFHKFLSRFPTVQLWFLQ